MLFLSSYLVCAFSEAQAQSMDILRLRAQLQTHHPGLIATPDTAFANTLTLLARAWYGINADSAFFYARQALAYSDKTAYEKGKAESWRMIGNTYEMIGDYQNMLSSYHESRIIAERIGNTSLVAKVNLNIALFFKQMGEYDMALRQMGNVNVIYETSGDSVQLAYVLSHLSDISFYQHQYNKAMEYATRAMQVSTALKDSLALASFNNDVGRILVAKGQYPDAIRRHRQSMEYYTRNDDRLGETETNVLLARAYLAGKDYTQALRYARASLDSARRLRRKKEIKESGQVLAAIYEAKGDYSTSLNYYKLYKDFSDSLFNEQNRKQTFALEVRYEYERKEDSLREAAVKKDIMQQHIDRSHTQQTVTAVLLIVFLIVLVLIQLGRRAEIRKANQLLVTKNQEIEQQKEAIEHQAVQLLLNNQQKDKLFSIIAHDLKGPLNSLKGLMDLLKENKLPESEIRSMMAELSRNVGYSSELVGNLLFWASSQLDGIVITPIVLPMRQMMDEIIAIYARQAADKNISFSNEIDPDATAFADPDMTQVIFRNLLSNAIKFCRAGDRITINSKLRDGKFIEICVADTGIGIREDVLEKIRRKESVTTYGTAKEKGTGLGMLLCREFAEANHGKFRVDSEWGKGSWFYFTIPLAVSPA
jgi:signal transduction histidine kinase